MNLTTNHLRQCTLMVSTIRTTKKLINFKARFVSPTKKSRVGKRVKTFSNNCHILSPATDHRYNDSMVEVQRHKVTASLSRDGMIHEMQWLLVAKNNAFLHDHVYLVGFFWGVFLCQLPSQRFSSFPVDDI